MSDGEIWWENEELPEQSKKLKELLPTGTIKETSESARALLILFSHESGLAEAVVYRWMFEIMDMLRKSDMQKVFWDKMETVVMKTMARYFPQELADYGYEYYEVKE